MRACANASLLVVLGLAFAATFSACSGGSTPDANSPEAGKDKPASEGEAAKTDETKTDGAKTDAPGGAATAAATPPPKKEPQSVDDCKQMLTEITNEPPKDGVVMNNAQPKDPSGKTGDRFEPLVEIVKSKRDAYRCCFDLWAKKNPGQKGKVTLVFELAPDGTLKGTKVDQDKSDIHAPEVESCMGDVSKSLTYPKSPTGKVTTFTYPFEFKARH